MHGYKPYGKVLFCSKCADVQPLLLSGEYDGQPESIEVKEPTRREAPAHVEVEDGPETVEDLEAQISLLRRSLNFEQAPQRGEQLGLRHRLDGDDLVDESNERTQPRVPVHEGFEGSALDEGLLDPGL